MSPSNDNYYQELFTGPLARPAELFKLLPITVNGQRRYSAPEQLPVLILSSRKVSVNGTQQTRTVLLLPGDVSTPAPGDLIDFDGRKRELTQIQFCRSLSGKTLAIECTVS